MSLCLCGDPPWRRYSTRKTDGRCKLRTSRGPQTYRLNTQLQLRDRARREYVLTHTIRATRARPRVAVYDWQDAFFMPLWGFWTVERPGPTIRIYRRTNSW